MSDDHKCKNCRFWLQQTPQDINGQCRRYPPNLPQTEQQQEAMKATGASVFVGLWPDTLGVDWCGEFQVREREFIDNPLQELNLSSRALTCLTKAGLKTIRDLLKMSVKEVRQIRNFGAVAFRELEIRLQEHGLSLRRG